MLDHSVLVLNRSWTPIAITTVKRGFSLVFQEHASIVDPDTYEMHDFESWLRVASMPAQARIAPGEAWIRTINLLIRVPEVVVLSRYNGIPRRELNFSRRNIFRRDNFECQYCGKRPGLRHLSIDHIRPISRGGATDWENCVVACIRCNTRKGNRSPEAAEMHLARAPFRPTWSDGVGFGQAVPDSWSRFVKA